MCPSFYDNTGTLKTAVGVLSISTVGLLAATIALAVKGNQPPTIATDTTVALDTAATSAATNFLALSEKSMFLDINDDICVGAQIGVDNKLCADLEVPTPQAGGNVTTSGLIPTRPGYPINPKPRLTFRNFSLRL